MENEENEDNLDKKLDDLLGEDKIKEEEKIEEEKKKALMLEKSEFICTNKWCKAKYIIEKFKYYDNKVTTCDKCRSFDTELSGGTTFERKDYSGNRHDGMPHQTDFKFSDYAKGKWGKFWGR